MPRKSAKTKKLAEPLDAHLDHVALCLVRYIGRHGHRMLQADGRLSDLYVSLQELRVSVGAQLPAGDEVEPVTERIGIPSVEETEVALAARREELIPRSPGAPGADSAVEEIRRLFELSDRQLQLLIAAAAPLLSVELARLYTFAWADFALKRPSAGFLAELLSEESGDLFELLNELRSDSPLVRHRLVILEDGPVWRQGSPLLHRTVSVPDAIIGRLMGHSNRLSLGTTLSLAPGSPASRSLEQLVASEETLAGMDRGVKDLLGDAEARTRLLLIGAPGSGRRTILSAHLATSGWGLLVLELDRLAEQPETFEEGLAEACREALLQHCVLLIRGHETLADPERLKVVLTPDAAALLNNHPGPLAITVRQPAARLHRLVERLFEVFVSPPSVAQQRTLWERALSEAGCPDERLPDQLVHRFKLTPGAICEAVESAQARSSLLASKPPEKLELEDLASAIRRKADHALSQIAEPFLTSLTWDDVVLPDETRERLREIVLHARQREKVLDGWGFRRKMSYGQGLSCLFAGPPGTGKTMMAGVLANELRREIYRVDVSRITSKWVGETEKNLARVFEEAERAQVILLFDEADSLFSTRTEVKSSNDRFANMEVNYLLQRMESYDGMTVLTTNFESSIDEAFRRRIRFWVDFPFPKPDQRTLLWRSMIPEAAQVEEGIPFEELGQEFHLSGGSIKNAVLRAAFFAVDAGGPISLEYLWQAATAETRDMGMLIREEG